MAAVPSVSLSSSRFVASWSHLFMRLIHFSTLSPRCLLFAPSFVARRSRVNIPCSGFRRSRETTHGNVIGTEFGVGDMLKQGNVLLTTYAPGDYERFRCPKCQGSIYNVQNVGVNSSPKGASAMWSCLLVQCRWTGSLAVEDECKWSNACSKQMAGGLTEESLHLIPLSKKFIMYFSNRGISEKTLNRNGVRQYRNAIAFPCRKDGKIVGCKYRTLQKFFWQARNGQRIFYGVDDIKHATEVIIVEGEIDKLSMEEAGFLNCVSVPDGAPAKVSESDLASKEQDKKFEFIWNCKEYFEKVNKIILATDSDSPGQALAEEIARRLGRERCWRVNWPCYGLKKLKDANEVLQYLGKQAICDMIQSAEPFPIRGLFRFSNFFKELDDYYYQGFGNESVMSTGWSGVDAFYRVVPGEMTLVTGVPNSGKSEWIDALICNLNHMKGWHFALCSMENKVQEHARKLLEKHLRKPFFNAPYAESIPRITKQELDDGKTWLTNNFFLIRCNDEELPSITWVLNLAKAAVMRHGIHGLVIDPYNELDHHRPSNQTETEYVSQMLSRLKRFAQHHDCHVWFVAHPRQLHLWHGEAPNLYDISGSAHFINKCDNGIVIHRNQDPAIGPLDIVQVLVRKIRNKAAGTIGDAFLSYDRVTGEYKDCN
eukprot:c20312_g1_i1 orf=569-2530(-)